MKIDTNLRFSVNIQRQNIEKRQNFLKIELMDHSLTFLPFNQICMSHRSYDPHTAVLLIWDPM